MTAAAALELLKKLTTEHTEFTERSRKPGVFSVPSVNSVVSTCILLGALSQPGKEPVLARAPRRRRRRIKKAAARREGSGHHLSGGESSAARGMYTTKMTVR
jgi:hypothetical protein